MTTKSKRAVGTYKIDSGKIGFQNWNLNAMDNWRDLVEDILKEGFALATSEYECNAWFPIEWSHENPEDPTTIAVELPIGEHEDRGPTWTFQLSDLVDSMIDLHEHGPGGPIDADDAPRFIAVRDSLQRLANRIDAALKRPQEEEGCHER